VRAFRTFAETASSLELSYATLRAEVARLEQELAASNSEVARTSEENGRIRAHLDRILEGLPCGVLVTSSDERILRLNPEARRILGKAVPDGELISMSELPAPMRGLLELSTQGDTELEREIGAAQDAVRWLALRHAPLADGGDIFILRDVSERKILDEVEAGLQRDRELAAISALLAHEIRNPLGSLELFAGLLMESPLDTEQRHWVEHLQAGLRTLAATVNNVLHFHSLPELQRAPLDLGQLLEWARAFFSPLARQSGVTLSLQNGLSGILLNADRHRLEQVLLNLILNSIHAVAEGGWVELSGRKLSDPGAEKVVLAVTDTGPGILPGDLSAIFEPGFSRRPGSPGLGLAVCRKIVEQHGGTLRAANGARHGAIFTATFPFDSGTEGVRQ
jgi:two-component system sensor histidine kinase FlrB